MLKTLQRHRSDRFESPEPTLAKSSSPMRLCQSGGEGRQQGLPLAPVIKATLSVNMPEWADLDKTATPLIGSRMGIVERAKRIIGTCDNQSGEAHRLRWRICKSGGLLRE